MSLPALSTEVVYLLVVVGLFFVPRGLQRVVPSAITCVAIGAVLGQMGFGLFTDDTAMPLLATLGIVSLFLFAGLEVEIDELKRGSRVLLWYLLLQAALLAACAAGVHAVFGLEWRAAILIALALLTPSCGFILDSLAGFGLDASSSYWVKAKAIGTEILALSVLFFTVHAGNPIELALSTGALIALIAILPFLFRLFARFILPFAPKTEFGFVLILGLVCAYATRHLGVYYLVGAFVVGFTAVRLRKRIPEFASDRLMSGIDLFASFFIPFYFFQAGLHLDRALFTWKAIALALVFLLVAIPLRVGAVTLFRRWVLGEPIQEGKRVGLALTPTLVFTLVIADIVHDQFGIDPMIRGALILFALMNTTLPGILLRRQPASTEPRQFEEPTAREAPAEPAS